MQQFIFGLLSGALGGVVTALIAIYQTRIFDRDKVIADFNAVRVVQNLLKSEGGIYRSFSMIRHYIGGYSDNELRKLLVRAGAVRAMSQDGREAWALWDRVVTKHKTKTSLPWKLRDELKTPKDEELFPFALPPSPNGTK